MNAAWISTAATTLLVALVFHAMPRLTRPELYFAVTVPAGFRDGAEARRILRRYRASLWASAALAGAIGAVAVYLRQPLWSGAGTLWLLAGATLAFADARRRVRPHAVEPSTVREAALAPRARAPVGGLAAQLGPFALLAAAGALLWRRFGELPERIPTHWNFAGQPDHFVARTPAAVGGVLAVGASTCAALALLALGLQKFSRPVAAGGDPARAERGFRRLNAFVLLGAEYLVAITFGAIALAPLARAGAALVPSLALAQAALAVGVVVALARLGQGGTRRAAPAPRDGAPVGDRTSDARWKWGLFYADADDPALFVEKRFGIGYTLNFGNRWSWIILALAAAIPVAAALLAR
ncbi:MAG TPA: DUF5808 domain-containing protein [Polyangia bacterium]|nr:DUF5808 domain-containing protein [Polyangia bacterium]